MGILNGREEEDCLAQSRKGAKETVRLLQRFRRCSGLGKEVVGLQIRTTTVTEMAEHSILDNEANGHRRTDKRRAPETWALALSAAMAALLCVCTLYSVYLYIRMVSRSLSVPRSLSGRCIARS